MDVRHRFAVWCCHLALLSPPLYSQGGASEACSSCHQEIYDSHLSTGMGRAFSLPGPANTLREDLQEAGVLPPGVRPALHGRPQERLLLSEPAPVEREGKDHQPGGEGDPLRPGFREPGRTYLHRTAWGALYQLPLAWYAEDGGQWAMSPGYDRPDHKRVQPADRLRLHVLSQRLPATTTGRGCQRQGSSLPGRAPQRHRLRALPRAWERPHEGGSQPRLEGIYPQFHRESGPARSPTTAGGVPPVPTWSPPPRDCRP